MVKSISFWLFVVGALVIAFLSRGHLLIIFNHQELALTTEGVQRLAKFLKMPEFPLVIEAMKNKEFLLFGSKRSFWDFYLAFGLLQGVFMWIIAATSLIAAFIKSPILQFFLAFTFSAGAYIAHLVAIDYLFFWPVYGFAIMSGIYLLVSLDSLVKIIKSRSQIPAQPRN